ncbi:glycosyltransferase family 4 protein [Sulfuriferula nivalis]|uniref:Sugar transferase n=1 Tax=Sulfuriferula nivalis TaxID=2675298 RepID=A0A809SG11_9PROT|nr:glycosyltransferase family 4 protein [Sulfuriferula nivalis]BBO99519.1 sugar transferase [Sulfuriferula nivalis]
MKIEIVSFTGNSGLTDYAISLARALINHAQIRVVSAQSLPNTFNNMGFKIERVFRRSRQYPIDIFKFLFGVITRKPDWIIFQGPIKFPLIDALVVRLIRLFGIKTAITVHDVLPHYPRKWSIFEFGFYYRSFDKVIAHSEAANRILLNQLKITKDILIVPHGVYDIFNLTNITQLNARKKIGQLVSDDFIVLFFGHLEPRKGLMEFLAMAKMCNQPEIKFLIAGKNDLSKHGQKYSDELDAARTLPNVIIHDSRIEFENVENYFSACDIVALPYLEGSTSGVLKLALAFGKPIIATSVGDLPEQTPEGGGILVSCDTNIAENFLNAITQIKCTYQPYSEAMNNAKQSANWAAIADSIFQHLAPQN